MKTVFALFALYEGLPMIPIERVCEDFFAPLTVRKLVEKTQSGEIALPVARMYNSERAAKAVHINDLAKFLDDQMEKARKELTQLQR